MIIRMSVIALGFSLCAGGVIAAERPAVEIQGGNVVIKSRGHVVQLTDSEEASDPVLSPDDTFVVFTRGRALDHESQSCDGDVKGNVELWSVRVDGKGARRLLASRESNEPRQMLCRFTHKQFSANGKQLYFDSAGWATSDSVHSYDFKSGKERFVAPANGFYLITACQERRYRNTLLVNQHRYFIGAGSYDWYWLVDLNGKDIGPVGEETAMFEDACDIKLAP